MDSSEEDGDDKADKGEERQGEPSSPVPTSSVAAVTVASRAATQRSTAGSLQRSTSEHTHRSLWTAHTHAHTQTHRHRQEENSCCQNLWERRGTTAECKVTQSGVRVGLKPNLSFSSTLTEQHRGVKHLSLKPV